MAVASVFRDADQLTSPACVGRAVVFGVRRMFDLGWSEIFLIGIVTLVALGPKELPQALRMVGQALRKVRSMTSEVHKQMDDLLRETELQDLRDQARMISPGALNEQARSLLDPDGTVQKGLSGMPVTPGQVLHQAPGGGSTSALPPLTPARPTASPDAPAPAPLPPVRSSSGPSDPPVQG